jgi:hypothetical protein
MTVDPAFAGTLIEVLIFMLGLAVMWGSIRTTLRAHTDSFTKIELKLNTLSLVDKMVAVHESKLEDIERRLDNVEARLPNFRHGNGNE